MTALVWRLLGVKIIFLEEALADKYFQIFLEASALDDLVSLTVMVRTVCFRSGECRIVLDHVQPLYPRLVIDNIEDFIDREPQRNEVLFNLKCLEWIWGEV